MSYLLNGPVCNAPEIKNNTSTWSLHDKEVLEQAQKQCRSIYGDDYCVRTIIKVEENTYKVICYDSREKK